MFAHPAKPPVKTAKVQRYDAATFVEHLSVAKLVLENSGALSDIADDSKAIEGYTKQKKIKATSLTLVVLDSNDQGPVIAPISANSNGAALNDVLAHLNNNTYKLKDVRVLGASVSPGTPIKFSGQDAGAALNLISARYEQILASAHKIPASEDARLQLKLLRLFMDGQHRDAAYICADNLKRILSTMSQDGTDAQVTNQLAKELETAEGELRQKMPY